MSWHGVVLEYESDLGPAVPLDSIDFPGARAVRARSGSRRVTIVQLASRLPAGAAERLCDGKRTTLDAVLDAVAPSEPKILGRLELVTGFVAAVEPAEMMGEAVVRVTFLLDASAVFEVRA